MTERTSVLTVKARRSGAPALEARAVLRPAVRRLGAVALGFAGGWAVLYGALMPFGLGLVLGLAEDCFAPCAAGAALGVLLHGFGALSLRSVCLLCALGAAVAVRWVWPGRFLPAVLAGCGTLAAMGLCFALGTGGGAELALFCTADALLAGLLGLALRRFPPEKPGFGTLLTGAAVAAALGNLPLERFFPGVAVCAVVWKSIVMVVVAVILWKGRHWPAAGCWARPSAPRTRPLPARPPGLPAGRVQPAFWPRAAGWKRLPPMRAAA